MEIMVVMVLVAMFATAFVLVLGLKAFAKGHDDADDLVVNNRYMRLRVEIQALAIALILFGIFLAHYWHF